MPVIIDMEMPESCEECKFVIWDTFGKDRHCLINFNEQIPIPEVGRLKDCPLREYEEDEHGSNN